MNVVRITLAAERLDAMVAFYNGVFQCGLVASGPLFHGELAGTPLVICPNRIAGVDASQSRHQLRFAVDDLAAVLANVATCGGAVLGDPTSSDVVGISDPDGNTCEIVQRA